MMMMMMMVMMKFFFFSHKDDDAAAPAAADDDDTALSFLGKNFWNVCLKGEPPVFSLPLPGLSVFVGAALLPSASALVGVWPRAAGLGGGGCVDR